MYRTLHEIKENIGNVAPGYLAEWDDESLVIWRGRTRELRILQTGNNKFRVAVRKHEQLKFEQCGGGRDEDFEGVLREIKQFTSP